MAWGVRRRGMVFVDGSALREAINRQYRSVIGSHGVAIHTRIHYQKLGLMLCGEDREFLRLNLYTGEPQAPIPPQDGRPARLGRIELTEHEYHTADRTYQTHQRLRTHVEDQCRFTSLATGRILASREQRPLKELLDWVRRVFDGIPPERRLDSDRRLMDEMEDLSQRDMEIRRQIAVRLSQLRRAKAIPRELMPKYSERLSEVLGSYVGFREKGVDVLLAVDMLSLCMDDGYDDAILVAADEDYIPVVRAVMRTGRRVVNAFLERGSGYHLRKACDDFRMISESELISLILEPGQIPSAHDRRTCPRCIERVHPQATTCPHCGSDLLPGGDEAPSTDASTPTVKAHPDDGAMEFYDPTI